MGPICQKQTVRCQSIKKVGRCDICFERNEGAHRLYRCLGFQELDRRAVVPNSTLRYHDGDVMPFAK